MINEDLIADSLGDGEDSTPERHSFVAEWVTLYAFSTVTILLVSVAAWAVSEGIW